MSALGARKNILEIGCSAGNIAEAFRGLDGFSYTGIDIDGNAIDCARRRFREEAFTFHDESAEEHARTGKKYDYILVAGMLHHTDDDTACSILKSTRALAAPGCLVNIYDPDTLSERDQAHMHWFYKLEQGQYLRDSKAQESLIARAGLRILSQKFYLMRPGFPGSPVVARFYRFIAQWEA